MYEKFIKKLKYFSEFCDTINKVAESEKYWLSNFSFKPRFLCGVYDLSYDIIKAARTKASRVYVGTKSTLR